MPVNTEAYSHIKSELDKKNITLIAVSKTKPVEDIKALYDHGHRDFGENYVQELVDKAAQLPTDIRWHFIGHLQSNKVKYIAPLVQLIHGVDSLKLLKEIGKQAQKNDRVIDCLLQVHIAQEETKFGLDEKELASIMESEPVAGTNVKGLMGMASFTDDKAIVQKEFHQLQTLYLKYPSFTVLSMGMSSDYEIAIEEGSTMVRIGSLLFGAR
jgi:pyridoxal phosphate enzyme (YggS family)